MAPTSVYVRRPRRWHGNLHVLSMPSIMHDFIPSEKKCVSTASFLYNNICTCMMYVLISD